MWADMGRLLVAVEAVRPAEASHCLRHGESCVCAVELGFVAVVWGSWPVAIAGSATATTTRKSGKQLRCGMAGRDDWQLVQQQERIDASIILRNKTPRSLRQAQNGSLLSRCLSPATRPSAWL